MDIAQTILKKNNAGNPCPTPIHALAQSVTVIHAYTAGCLHRLNENSLDKEQLHAILQKIKQHTELMSQQLHALNPAS